MSAVHRGKLVEWVARPQQSGNGRGLRVLVTGGAGFIGSHVVDAVLAAGHTAVVVDNLSTGGSENVSPEAELVRLDIRDPRLNAVFARVRPDVVSHHAAQADVRRSMHEPDSDADVNIIGGINVLRCAARNGVRKVIYASTAAVYGEPVDLPVSETHRLRPLSGYGISKLALEHYVEMIALANGMEFTIVRYANVYGPRQDPHGEAGVVAIFALRMLEDRACTIFGDGSQTRDFVFVGDCAALNVALLDGVGSGRTYNVGTGVETDVARLH